MLTCLVSYIPSYFPSRLILIPIISELNGSHAGFWICEIATHWIRKALDEIFVTASSFFTILQPVRLGRQTGSNPSLSDPHNSSGQSPPTPGIP
jgi:hypothetical protein